MENSSDLIVTVEERGYVNYLLLGLSNDGGEDGLRAIFTGDTGLATTGTIVNYDGGLSLRHCGKE